MANCGAIELTSRPGHLLLAVANRTGSPRKASGDCGKIYIGANRVYGTKLQRAGALQNAGAYSVVTDPRASVLECGCPPPLFSRADQTVPINRTCHWERQ
jgi:hypothetical protein